MLAGFSFGLALAAVGPPRRLAHQLFAVTDGLFGPLFFVWLGASLNLRDLGEHPSYIVLAGCSGSARSSPTRVMRLDRPAGGARCAGRSAARRAGRRRHRRHAAAPAAAG